MTKEEKYPIHPKYLPYTQVAMGMIQPEWIFMSHFFEDEEEEQPEAVCLSAIPTASPATVMDKKETEIQIHFHARQEHK
ncbi:hypothetical protein [Laceyella putida]|uniref:Uncharacterized protein n=1 Tax=Laceyella putida TaxID=110101 RepID=A0ABW2RPN5_9BACL